MFVRRHRVHGIFLPVSGAVFLIPCFLHKHLFFMQCQAVSTLSRPGIFWRTCLKRNQVILSFPGSFVNKVEAGAVCIHGCTMNISSSPEKEGKLFWPHILGMIFLLFHPCNFIYTLAVKMVRCLCFYTPFLPLENFVLYHRLEYHVVFRYHIDPPSEQVMEEKCSYILSNHPGHGESGEIKMDEIHWPDKTCSFFPDIIIAHCRSGVPPAGRSRKP